MCRAYVAKYDSQQHVPRIHSAAASPLPPGATGVFWAPTCHRSSLWLCPQLAGTGWEKSLGAVGPAGRGHLRGCSWSLTVPCLKGQPVLGCVARHQYYKHIFVPLTGHPAAGSSVFSISWIIMYVGCTSDFIDL